MESMPQFAQSRFVWNGAGVALPSWSLGKGVFVLLLPVFTDQEGMPSPSRLAGAGWSER